MMQPTGSVYLDAPARPRHRPSAEPAGRRREILADGGIVAGLMALIAVIVIVGIRMLVIDPQPALSAFDATLAHPDGRADLERALAEGIEEGLVGDEVATAAAAFGLDVEAEAARIAPAVVDDKAALIALRDLVAAVHAAVLQDADARPLDLAPVNAAVRQVMEREAPRLAAALPDGGTIWTIDDGSLPDLTGTVSLLGQVLPFAVPLSLCLPVGVFLHPRRHRAAAWVGWTAIGFGVVCVFGALSLPGIAGSMTGQPFVSIATSSESLHLLAPAGLAGIVGMVLISFASVARHRENRLVVEEGAAAALGYNEPALWPPTGAATIDLPARGLVDVNHPLTNI